MHLVDLTCEDFRCLSDIHFEPSPGTNVIRGHNAQGKTSLLEAILFGATSKSHRTKVETDLVGRQGAQGFNLNLRVRRNDRDVTIALRWRQGVKHFSVNGVAQGRVSEILGKVKVVLFTPEDIALIKGGASVRRRFLDMELSQLSPAYLNALQRYRQALRHRNELLRGSAVDEEMLSVWDEQLARQGAVLIRERGDFIEEVAALSAEAYGRIADGEAFTLTYKPDVAPEESLAEALEKSRTTDLRRRVTCRGPHRDDLEFMVGGRGARSFGSQGQQKSAVLALKLAELELVNAHTGEYPILMLDEVLAELDDLRAKRLFGAIDESIQCLITTTELGDHRGLFNEGCSHFYIEGGRLTGREL